MKITIDGVSIELTQTQIAELKKSIDEATKENIAPIYYGNMKISAKSNRKTYPLMITSGNLLVAGVSGNQYGYDFDLVGIRDFVSKLSTMVNKIWPGEKI